MKKALMFLFSVLCLLTSAGISNATPIVENGGFEGDLTGWNSVNAAFQNQVTSQDGKIVSAYEGTYMAVLSPGLGSADASLSQAFNAGEYAGQQLQLSFAYNLQGLDKVSNDYGLADTFSASVSVGGGTTVLLSKWIDDSSGDQITKLYGWQTFSALLPVVVDPSGDLTISFYLENTSLDGGLGDWRQDASAYIDAVSVRAVPDASIMFLLGPGLVGLGLLGRRKFVKK